MSDLTEGIDSYVRGIMNDLMKKMYPSETGKYFQGFVTNDPEKAKNPNKEKIYSRANKIISTYLGKKYAERQGSVWLDMVCFGIVSCENTPGYYDSDKLEKCKPIYLGKVGELMEDLSGMMKLLNEEVGISADVVKNAYNDIMGVSDQLIPQLGEMVKEVRTKRMTLVTELKQSLNMMKDVRQFFLDKDYNTEVDRLERFCTVAERLKALIEDGTMDAVTDIILKLHLTEATKNENKGKGNKGS